MLYLTYIKSCLQSLCSVLETVIYQTPGPIQVMKNIIICPVLIQLSTWQQYLLIFFLPSIFPVQKAVTDVIWFFLRSCSCVWSVPKIVTWDYLREWNVQKSLLKSLVQQFLRGILKVTDFMISFSSTQMQMIASISDGEAWFQR